MAFTVRGAAPPRLYKAKLGSFLGVRALGPPFVRV